VGIIVGHILGFKWGFLYDPIFALLLEDFVVFLEEIFSFSSSIRDFSRPKLMPKLLANFTMGVLKGHST